MYFLHLCFIWYILEVFETPEPEISGRMRLLGRSVTNHYRHSLPEKQNLNSKIYLMKIVRMWIIK